MDLKGLNAEQRQAVIHDHRSQGPLLVLAGAGSGKTSVLTRRILYRIHSGVEARHLLALTFTAKAAAEMDERVRHSYPEGGVRLCTFHALGLHILRSEIVGVANWQRVGFCRAPTPAEDAGLGWVEFLAEQGLPPGSLERECLFNPDVRIRGGKKTLQALRAPVLGSGRVVFEDLIWLSITLLRDFPEVRAWARACWHEILVDEYQDIDPAQYQLVLTLLDGREDLFVVGDDDQAIYGFRGADIGNILRFQSDFPNCRLVRLEWNYRSTPAVLEVANRIFSDKPASLRKTLRTGAARPYALFRENRTPEIWRSQTPLEEILRLVATMRELRENYEMQWSDFAILVRYNRQRLYYRTALEAYGIPLLPDGDSDGAVDVLEGIHVETVHASKGLQYPVVFYAGLAQGLTPGECMGSRRERRAQFSEEKRLFYVGVTRAEAYLVFLFCRRRHWRGRLCSFSPSPFLGNCVSSRASTGLPMPVLLFKVQVVCRVLLYLAARMPSYVFTRLFRPQETKAWIERNADHWCRFCLRVMRMELRIEGQEKLAQVDWSRPVIVVGNHESYADIPVVLLAVGRILGFLAKKELAYIPFLAYWMRQIGCLFIDRGKKGAGGEVSQKISGIGQDTRIVIFPEGTRSRNGQLGTFKSGAFRLACELDATLLPIVHCGTREGWETRCDSRTLQPVRAQVLEPLDVRELRASLGREISAKGDLLNPIRDRLETARKNRFLCKTCG